MKELNVEKLTFDRGDESFSKDDFVKKIKPYFADLQQVGRTNFLFVSVSGDGKKTDVTGYRTDVTINATLNSRVLECEKSGGKWAVYRLD